MAASIEGKLVAEIQNYFINLRCHRVTERCSCQIQGLHPHAHSELSRIWHTPDVGVVSYAFISEIKRIVCGR